VHDAVCVESALCRTKNGGDHDGESTLEAARRADAGDRPDEQAGVEAASMDQRPFENVRMTTQMRPAHSQVGETSSSAVISFHHGLPRPILSPKPPIFCGEMLA
jgi:hypothetical protein